MNLEPTRRGGVRRTRIAQKTEPKAGSASSPKAPGQSATQIKWRRAVRIPRRVQDVVQVHLNEKLGLPECPYVIRWRVEFPFGSIRVHHWLSSDDRRAVHDHPWWFLTLVVKGYYRDKGERWDYVKAPALRFRRAEHRHTVIPGPQGAWTILVTGRPLRKWGFYPKGKFVRSNKWFLSYGHHPCN